MKLSLIGHDNDAKLISQKQRQHRQRVQATLARDAETAGQIAAGHIELIRVRMNHLAPESPARRRQKAAPDSMELYSHVNAYITNSVPYYWGLAATKEQNSTT